MPTAETFTTTLPDPHASIRPPTRTFGTVTNSLVIGMRSTGTGASWKLPLSRIKILETPKAPMVLWYVITCVDGGHKYDSNYV